MIIIIGEDWGGGEVQGERAEGVVFCSCKQISENLEVYL
jgi:hypothetical protein